MSTFADRVRDVVEPEDAARAAVETTEFRDLGGRYRLDVPGVAVFDLDHLRREGGALKAEMLVSSTLPGARTVDGTLTVVDVNLSSQRTRKEAARYLAERSNADSIDWTGLIEELAQRTLAAERRGSPAVLLSSVAKSEADEILLVDGIQLLARHPSIIFGDGGTAKSLLGLYCAGSLAERGIRCGYFDWELDANAHRDRLERLFGPSMPPVHYVRCSRPLVYEADRLRRIVREHELEFAVFDSIAFACDAAPENAETAGKYAQAVRQLGEIGTLHLAHISKALEGADLKPFGSVFWFNFGRSLFNVKIAAGSPGDRAIQIALHDRKFNLGAKRPSLGFEITFDPDETRIRRVDPAGVPELAVGLSLSQRIRSALRSGAKSRDEIAVEFEDTKADTLRRILHREIQAKRIIRLPGPTERFSLPYPGNAA